MCINLLHLINIIIINLHSLHYYFYYDFHPLYTCLSFATSLERSFSSCQFIRLEEENANTLLMQQKPFSSSFFMRIIIFMFSNSSQEFKQQHSINQSRIFFFPLARCVPLLFIDSSLPYKPYWHRK